MERVGRGDGIMEQKNGVGGRGGGGKGNACQQRSLF